MKIPEVLCPKCRQRGGLDTRRWVEGGEKWWVIVYCCNCEAFSTVWASKYPEHQFTRRTLFGEPRGR